MKKAAVYIRVSTDEQAKTGYSIGEQRERLLAYCKAKDWVVYDVYVDGGYSGSNLDRPAIQRLQADISNFDIVLVYKLDRLSRSQFDILALIEKTFLPNGVDFVSMSESFDTSTPFGRAMIGILGVFAQLEREQIKERSMMGKKARAKKGKYHGGGKIPIGYDYDGEKLIPNEYEAAQIRLIFQMVADNKSNVDILQALNAKGYTMKYGEWKASSRIQLTIKNNVYVGVLKFGDIVYENAHEPLISKELFDKANAVRATRKAKFGNDNFKGTTVLHGLIWCGLCGARYATTNSKIRANGTRNRFHACYSRAFPKSHMAKQNGCTGHIFTVSELERLIKSEIDKISLDGTFFDKATNKRHEQQDNSKGVKKRIAEIDSQLKKLMDLYTLDKMPFDVITAKVNDLHKEKSALAAQIENVTQTPAITKQSIDEFKAMLGNVTDMWEFANVDERRMLLSALIDRITIDEDRISIKWTFDSGNISPSVIAIEKPVKVQCPFCGEFATRKDGTHKGRQRYKCCNNACSRWNFFLDG